MSSQCNFTKTSLDGLYKIKYNPIEDNRGFFNRLFCNEKFKALGLKEPISQINKSFTKIKGTVRGMHYQNFPYTETKIISCNKGEIFDVVIDIRKNSSTFLKWHAEILSENNNYGLYVPEGFAHGFQTLTDSCELIYLHTKAYNSEYEGAINVLDPLISIKWPLKISEISNRDKKHVMINEKFKGIKIL